MIADVLAVKRGRVAFTWGQAHPDGAGVARDTYLAALRALDADDKDIKPLLEFARS
jgi:hypothetical protein